MVLNLKVKVEVDVKVGRAPMASGVAEVGVEIVYAIYMTTSGSG